MESDLYGRKVVAVTRAYDAQLKPLGDLALGQLDAQSRERIIDIGCGAGQTCLQLADSVGGAGFVLGVDRSPMLVDYATTRTYDLPQIEMVEADASTYAFEPRRYDALFSRFGVMAFPDPVAAFLNFWRALKPDGRLAFVCWRHFDENELDYLPFNAAATHLPPEHVDTVRAAYPFSFAEADNIKSILSAAGFDSITCNAHDMPVCAGNFDETLELCLTAGALGQRVRVNPALRAQVIDPVREALAKKDSSDGLYMNAAVWVVTAKAG